MVAAKPRSLATLGMTKQKNFPTGRVADNHT